ncbi:MAG TPA: Arc family DNA-binding protein [Gaiellaceae bacterium]
MTKHTALRVPEETLRRLRLIAAAKGTSLSSEILAGIQSRVEEFERDPQAAIDAAANQRLDRLEATGVGT